MGLKPLQEGSLICLIWQSNFHKDHAYFRECFASFQKPCKVSQTRSFWWATLNLMNFTYLEWSEKAHALDLYFYQTLFWSSVIISTSNSVLVVRYQKLVENPDCLNCPKILFQNKKLAFTIDLQKVIRQKALSTATTIIFYPTEVKQRFNLLPLNNHLKIYVTYSL